MINKRQKLGKPVGRDNPQTGLFHANKGSIRRWRQRMTTGLRRLVAKSGRFRGFPTFDAF